MDSLASVGISFLISNVGINSYLISLMEMRGVNMCKASLVTGMH